MKLSIIITTYNRLNYLKELLSNLDYFKEKVEIIVIDHGSTDGTKLFMDNLSYKYVYLPENTGTPSFPRNIGAKKSEGEYLIFLDSDDLIRESIVNSYVASIKDLAPDLIYSRAATFEGRDNYIIPKGQGKPDGEISSSLIWGNYIPLLTAAVRREVHFKVGGWDEDMSICGIEDFDYFLRIALEGSSFKFIPEVLADYRVSENSLSSNKSRERLLILRVYRKLMFRYPKKLPIFIAAYIKQLTAYCLIKLGFLGN